MKVILIKDLKGKGKAGEIIEVNEEQEVSQTGQESDTQTGPQPKKVSLDEL